MWSEWGSFLGYMIGNLHYQSFIEIRLLKGAFC